MPTDKKGYVMYRSFIDSIRVMDAENFKQCILALSDYAFDGIDYEGDNPTVVMYMTLVKPQIDANNQRYENGKKGGRPPKEPKEKQNEEDLADVEAIPLNDGSEWKPTVEQIDEWTRLYPNVDIEQEFRNMRGWCSANKDRRKTPRGVKKFVTGWLAREQDKGKRHGLSGATPTYITNQLTGNLPKGRPATAETLEAVRKMQEDMIDA